VSGAFETLAMLTLGISNKEGKGNKNAIRVLFRFRYCNNYAHFGCMLED